MCERLNLKLSENINKGNNIYLQEKRSNVELYNGIYFEENTSENKEVNKSGNSGFQEKRSNVELYNGIYFEENTYKNEEVNKSGNIGLQEKRTNVELYNGIYFEENTPKIEEVNKSGNSGFQGENGNYTNIMNNTIRLEQYLYGGRRYLNYNSSLNLKSDSDELIKIANFFVEAKSIIIKDDGLNKEIVYVIKCTLRDNLDSRLICLNSRELNNYEWVKKKLGIKYYIDEDDKAYKQLEIFISEEFSRIKEKIEYIQVGWRLLSSRWVYLHANGAIGLSNSDIKGCEDKSIDKINISAEYALYESFKLLELSNDIKKTLPLFLFSHLAVVKELFVQAGVEPKFCLWVYGLTGSMKTSVSKVFLNLFNTGKKSDIAATFKDTIAAIEMKSFDYKDSVLLVDDFHPTTSATEKREMEKLASDILRRYGDGICKSRATKDMTKQKQFPPRGLCVITGEDRLGGESTVARYVSIEVKPGDFKSQELAYFQNNPLIFSTHMYYFIEWISNRFYYLKTYINSKFIDIRNENLNNFRHGRMNEAFAVFSIIGDIFLNYAMENNYIDEFRKNDMLLNWKNIIFNVIKTHENSNIKQSPGIMYLIAIKELMDSGKLHLIDMDNCYDKKNKEKGIGYECQEKICLIPNIAYAEVKSFWRNLGIEFPISSESGINKILDEMGAIEVKFEGTDRRRTIKISGDSRRFLVIYKHIIESVLDSID